MASAAGRAPPSSPRRGAHTQIKVAAWKKRGGQIERYATGATRETGRLHSARSSGADALDGCECFTFVFCEVAEGQRAENNITLESKRKERFERKEKRGAAHSATNIKRLSKSLLIYKNY
jgi:hypothetical protein